MGDMKLIEVLVYLDDIIVFGKTLEEHEEHLEKVLKRLHDEGVEAVSGKVPVLSTLSQLPWPHCVCRRSGHRPPQRPTNMTEIRSFLGFCFYYRRFVKGFAKTLTLIWRSLSDLLESPEIF